MPDSKPSIFHRFFDRVFPSMPDFFGLLTEQSIQVRDGVALLVRLMETADPEIGNEIRREEHEADKTKLRNLQILNESFATPVDREDIYRAIVNLDEILNYCKTTVYEMYEFELTPDQHLIEMSTILREGCEALAEAFAKLKSSPAEAAELGRVARKSERRVEKAYRSALAELFQGTDYVGMLKRREVYRHVSNAADRVAICGNTLQDIVVKIS